MTQTPEPEPTVQHTEEKIGAYEAQRRADQPDMILGLLVDTVKPGKEGPGVTLTVGGNLVTGVIVHRIDWLGELIDSGHTGLTPLKESWESTAAEEALIDEDDPLEPYNAMVHLKDAHWFGSHDGAIPPLHVEGTFWRGRLSEVQGFVLSVLTDGPNSPA